MHIVLANRWYPPHTGYGGVAMYNYYLAHGLVRLGHRVTVVAARWSKSPLETAMDEQVTVHRLLISYRHKLHRLPLIGRYMRAVNQYLYSRRVACVLRGMEKSNPPDVIEFADVNAEGYAYLRQKRRCPVVVRCHTPTFVLRNYYSREEMPYDTSFIGEMEKHTIHAADGLTTPSHDMAMTIAQACKLTASSFRVIPNGLDVSLFTSPETSRIPPRDSEADEDIVILHVGRLERIKGIGVLAQAIPSVVAQSPTAHFVFIGEGAKWQAELEQFAYGRGMQNHITVVGGVDLQTLLAWYQKADIAVVPSLNYESFSYTCAQAMAAGIPLVASRIGGIPETVAQGEAALLVPPGDVTALQDAILKLIRNTELRHMLSVRGAEIAQERFASRIVAEQMVDMYASIV